MRSNGGWQYFENGTMIADGSIPAVNRYRVVMCVSHARLDIQVNGNMLDVNGNEPGTGGTPRGSAAETANNYISLGGNHTDVHPCRPVWN